MSQVPVSIVCESTGPPRQSNDKSLKSKDLDKDYSKLRSACDACHAAKIRCTGGTPCARCERDSLECHYSYKAKIGKPRGSMNKKTIERLRQMKEAREKQQPPPPTPPPTANENAQNTTPTTTIIPPLPSCDKDLAFSSIQSPFNTRQTLDDQSPPNFNLDPFQFEDSILLDNGFDGMENWLPATTENCIEKNCLPLPDNLNELHADTELSTESSRGKPNGNDNSFEKPTSHSISTVEVGFPYFSPYSPRSSRGSLDLQSRGGLFPDHSRSSFSGSSCHNVSSGTWFTTLSNHLCTLQEIPRTSEQSRAVGVLLIQSQRIIPSLRYLFKCHHCMRDTQALFLINMILSRLLRWTQASICAYGAQCTPAEVRLGKYHASGEFGAVVAKMLIQTHLTDLKTTTEAFAHIVGKIGHGEADGAYLSLQARNNQKELDGLVERIQKDI